MNKYRLIKIFSQWVDKKNKIMYIYCNKPIKQKNYE